MMDMSALFRMVHLSVADASSSPILGDLAIAGVALYATAFALLWFGGRWRAHHA